MLKWLVCSIFVCWLLAGCQPSVSFAPPLPNRIAAPETHTHIKTMRPTQAAVKALRVVLVPSELVLGPNRFAVGLLDEAGRVIHDANVKFRYFDLSDPQSPQVESTATARRLQTPDGHTTIFTHERHFGRAGVWGVEVAAQLPDGTTLSNRIRFEVVADPPSVVVGEQAPIIDTPTLASVDGDIRRFSSAPVPNGGFYRMSLADALTNGKPTVLLFATPAFCQTRFCASTYEIVSHLQHKYGDDLNFLHVEVYSGLPNPAANQWQLVPSMAAFGLTTEPWLYLIDASGHVVYRVEGMFTEAEVEGYLQALRRS